jgi:CheY-like chemotaxis protein
MGKTYNKTILVVDDEEDIRNYLSKALSDAGFEVKCVSDGFEALQEIEKHPPDLISLDLVMPKHSGLKLYRELQKNKIWSKIPVLIVTGHAHDELGKVDFEAMIMQGPGIYLEKPVKPEKYIEIVCQLLNLEVPDYIIEMKKNTADKLRAELMKSIGDSDIEQLQKALDAMKNK